MTTGVAERGSRAGQSGLANDSYHRSRLGAMFASGRWRALSSHEADRDRLLAPISVTRQFTVRERRDSSKIAMSLRRRTLTYAGLCAWTVAVVTVTRCLAPAGWKWTRVLSLALAYVGASGIAGTLVIGPVNVVLRRPNPISINLRRDIGIWAALSTLAHIWFGLQVHLGGRIREYFFAAAPARLIPRLDPFGVANHAGAVAALFVTALLAASSDLSLRRLGAGRWKALQRLSYPLFALTAVHSWIYQLVEHRAAAAVAAFSILFAAVCAMQTWGYLDRRGRRRMPSS